MMIDPTMYRDIWDYTPTKRTPFKHGTRGKGNPDLSRTNKVTDKKNVKRKMAKLSQRRNRNK